MFAFYSTVYVVRASAFPSKISFLYLIRAVTGLRHDTVQAVTVSPDLAFLFSDRLSAFLAGCVQWCKGLGHFVHLPIYSLFTYRTANYLNLFTYTKAIDYK